MLKPISNLSILKNNRKPKDFYDDYSMSSKRKTLAQSMESSIEQLENIDEYFELEQ